MNPPTAPVEPLVQLLNEHFALREALKMLFGHRSRCAYLRVRRGYGPGAHFPGRDLPALVRLAL